MPRRYITTWLCLLLPGCTTPHVYHHTARANEAPAASQQPNTLATNSVATTPAAPAATPTTAAAAAPLPTATATPTLACKSTPACASEGRCHAQGNTCVAKSYADCTGYAGAPQKGKTGCATSDEGKKTCPKVPCPNGKCTIDNGACKAVRFCSESVECKQYGLCGARDDFCYARTKVDCQRSQHCTRAGACSISGGRCRVGDAKDCTESEGCRADGRCSFARGEKRGDTTLPHRCVVASNEDCRNAKVCKDDKACTAVGNRCIVSCKDTDECKRAGRCTLRPADPSKNQGAACIVGSDLDCAQSKACLTAGACALVGRRCAARDDVACLRSTSCKEQGRCHAKRGRCHASSNIDCQRSTVACAREGRCRFQNGACVR